MYLTRMGMEVGTFWQYKLGAQREWDNGPVGQFYNKQLMAVIAN